MNLTCDSCDFTTDGIAPAVEHVAVSPDHKMSGENDDTTVRIAVDFDDEDEDWGDEE